MSQWISFADQEPPEEVDAVYGWWCYWRDYISWETSDDRPGCATHWCKLPKAPPHDPVAAAKARGESV